MRDISFQIRRLLTILGSIFILFAARVYYLAVIKHEHHLKEAKKFALKTSIKTPDRGTIRDRFNKPLAVNSICYNIAVLYEPIKALPRRQICKGKGTRYPRKEAIEKLADFLKDYTEMNAEGIRDLIYSKATLFPNTPFIIAKHVSEDIFYKLKMKEMRYPGLSMQISSKRTYPEGKTACHLLGYMGSINEREHLAIKNKINELTEYLENHKNGVTAILPKGYNSVKECRDALGFLIDRSYTIHSQVGKTGVEKVFDKELKGLIGKDYHLVDLKGNRRCKLPESFDETPGRRLLLTISSELQDHCEKLLSDSEKIRSEGFEMAGKHHNLIPTPWICGGSIIAMLPDTGEIVAMASYPTFDPNDFSQDNKSKALKWLETPYHIGKIFDGKYPLEKDVYNITTEKWEHQSKELNFHSYVDTILSKNSKVKAALYEIKNIHKANFIQNCFEMLLTLSEESDMHALMDALYPKKPHLLTFHKTDKEKRSTIMDKIKNKTTLLNEIRQELDPYLYSIAKNDDKILLLDILRVFCPNHLFDDTLLAETGKESLATYKEFCNAKYEVEQEVLEITKKVFHTHEFADWRNDYFKDYLKSKRAEEREQKRPAKPYLTYLEEMEKKLFNQFFSFNKWEFISAYLTVGAPIKEGDIRQPYFQKLIQKSLNNNDPSYVKLKVHLQKLPPEQVIPYIKTMRSFNELNRPLLGKYYFAYKSGKNQTEKDLARAFYPGNGFSFSKSHAFVDNMPLGSSFKLFVGFEALMNYFETNPNMRFPLNPMTIIDKSPPYSAKINSSTVLGYYPDYTPIKRIHKGGRLPRGHQNIGEIDFIQAMERSSNLYYSLLTCNVIKKPETLISSSKELGFGQRTHIDLPYEAKGSIPTDIMTDKTSLYSFAIGQHSLIVTPLQTITALNCLATNGELLKPQIIKAIANVEPTKDPAETLNKKHIKYEEHLKNIGIFFPLFPEAENGCKTPYIKKSEKEVVRKIDIPEPVHKTLMQSLYNVVNSQRGTARPSSIGSLLRNPYKRSIYKSVMDSMGGKTSTAEIAYNPTLDRQQPPIITKNIWFTAISFKDPGKFKQPELVVIVQLDFGSHGKEAAPLAASVIHKWKEILEKESRH